MPVVVVSTGGPVAVVALLHLDVLFPGERPGRTEAPTIGASEPRRRTRRSRLWWRVLNGGRQGRR
jgi:hypothetical protein